LPCGRILDEPADAIATFAGAFAAFDAEHVELILDVAKHEISPLRHDGDITTGLAVGTGGLFPTGRPQAADLPRWQRRTNVWRR
jgi:hypothetical protein